MKRLLSVLFAFSVSQTLPAAPSLTGAPAIIDTFKTPVISLTWIYDTAKSVKITVQDSSNGETGFLVYRADSLSAPFKMVAQAVSANPLTQDSVFVFDSTMAVNSYNIYKVAAYRSGDTLVSAPCTTYIYKDLGAHQIIKFTKVGNFPVANAVGWSALVGDSLYLKDTTTPAGKFTVINVTNPAAPVRGAIDSTTLLNYPLNTLIPVFIKNGVSDGASNPNIFSYQDKILWVNDPNTPAQGIYSHFSITLLQINGSSLTPLNSFSFYSDDKMTGFELLGVFRFNDSTFGLEYVEYAEALTDVGQVYLSLFQISSTQLIDYGGPMLYNCIDCNLSFFISGLYDNKILIGYSPTYSSMVTPIGLDLYDLATETLVNGGICSNRGVIFSQNSSYYFNSTMYFPDDSSYIYATDVRDVNGRATASANNALYSDSGYGNRQNLFIDTTRKLLFILYNNNLSTFSYNTTVKVAGEHIARPQHSAGIVIIPGSASAGVTIVLHGFSGPAELSFYDMSGRMVDKITGVTANAVRWRPKSRTMGCYIVCAKSGAEKSVARFVAR